MKLKIKEVLYLYILEQQKKGAYVSWSFNPGFDVPFDYDGELDLMELTNKLEAALQ